ncbi:MFS transporter [Streptomyces sp. GC420]|nr:MFS transporter [Streptomyces sp. GC420]
MTGKPGTPWNPGNPGSPRDRRPLATALVANAVSITGNALTVIGVPWFVLQTTGSAARAGLVAFCATLPVVVSALVGGPVIDRVGRRRISIASDVVCGLAVGAIPLLHHAGLLAFWGLCALMAVTGLFHGPGETARGALLPALAERAGTPMTRAASWYDGVSRGARMLGAALGGVLIAVFGAQNVLVLDAVTFAASALLVALGVRGVAAAEPRGNVAPVSVRAYRAELREGYAFVARTPLLLAITLVVMVTNGLDQGWSAVLLPTHADRELGGSVDLGFAAGMWGAGAVTGTALYGAFGHRLPRRPVFAVCFLVIGLPRFAMAAFSSEVLPLALLLAVCGLGAGALNPILSTVMYETVPEELRSRVLGVTTAGVLMTTPLGGLAAGFLVEGVGLAPAILAVGGAYFLATLAPLVFPVWRGMDRTAAGADTPAATGTANAAAADAEGTDRAEVSRTGPGPGPTPAPSGPTPRRPASRRGSAAAPWEARTSRRSTPPPVRGRRWRRRAARPGS